MAFEYKHFDLLAPLFTLAADQGLTNQAVVIPKDSDFIWENISLQYPGNSGNGLPFSVRFTDPTGYQFSDGLIGSFAFAGGLGLGVPYTLKNATFCPAASAILLDLQNGVSASNGPFQFILSGRKRFYVPD